MALQSLAFVDGLQKNRSDAKDSKLVMAVKRAAVDTVEPHIKPVLWSMISLQLATSARPGEVRLMKMEDIRNRFGLEASRLILGHSSADPTLVYAERDFEAAEAVIRQMG